MSATGTAILIAALLSALVCFGVGFGDVPKIADKTLFDMRFPAMTVASVWPGLHHECLGHDRCLGLVFAPTGHWFPFLAPILGWVGVFLTGSTPPATCSSVACEGNRRATGYQPGPHRRCQYRCWIR